MGETRKLGWFCTYTPVEVLHAAGARPVGIKSDSGAEHEDVLLGDAMCSYVRSCMGGALTGVYDGMEGVVISHACECMRRLSDGWNFRQGDIKPEMLHLLDVPKVITDSSVKFFANGIRRMAKDLEAKFGPISEESLKRSMALFAETRNLFSEIDAIRKEKTACITGLEVEELITESWDMDREELNTRLAAFIDEKRSQLESAEESKAPRIMVIGGPGNKSLIPAIEEAGGVSVVENMCSGLRAYTGESTPNEDPYMELAEFYLSKTPCPRMLGKKGEETIDELKEMIKEYKVDGIVYYSMKFCANMQMQYALLKNEDVLGVPMKALEGDISSEVNEREVHSFIKRLAKGKKGKRSRRRGGLS